MLSVQVSSPMCLERIRIERFTLTDSTGQAAAFAGHKEGNVIDFPHLNRIAKIH
jgi:hypothetical protein